jgi:hypothetical protein
VEQRQVGAGEWRSYGDGLFLALPARFVLLRNTMYLDRCAGECS